MHCFSNPCPGAPNTPAQRPAQATPVFRGSKHESAAQSDPNQNPSEQYKKNLGQHPEQISRVKHGSFAGNQTPLDLQRFQGPRVVSAYRWRRGAIPRF